MKNDKLNGKLKFLFRATNYEDNIIERGFGSKVWDVDGKEYFDLNAGQFCLSFGHGYTPFIECIYNQMKKIYHTNTATLTPEVLTAAEKMSGITDYKLKKTMFLSTGAEANEAALRICKFVTGRNGVMCFDKGYHGLTLAAQSCTYGGIWARPLVSDIVSVITPDYLHSDKSMSEKAYYEMCIDDLEKKFLKYGEKTAAVIMEPVIGVGGMVTIPYDYMKRVRELCDEYGTKMILDECQSGFGRSGQWFVYQKAELTPDVLVSAKAMGMGLAVSAVTFKEDIAASVEGKIYHFSSHQNDPVSATAVVFVINEIVNNNLLQENQKKGEYLLKMLKKICDSTETLTNARGNGLMCAFDIDDSVVHDYREYSKRYVDALKKNGIMIQTIRQDRTFRILPSYYVKYEEIDQWQDIFIKSMKEV